MLRTLRTLEEPIKHSVAYEKAPKDSELVVEANKSRLKPRTS